MSPAWRYVLYAGGYVLLLPTTLVGLLLSAVFYDAREFRFHEGMLYAVAGTTKNGDTLIWGRPGAQTLGWFTIGADWDQLMRVDLRAHEATHVVQALVAALVGVFVAGVLCPLLGAPAWLWGSSTTFGGGLMFDVIYGLCFVVPFALHGFTNWHDAYHENPLEKHAYRVGDKRSGWGTKPLSPVPVIRL